MIFPFAFAEVSPSDPVVIKDEMEGGEQPTGSQPKLSLPLENIDQLPPLKQVTHGIAPHEVTCKDGFELIFKSTNGNPTCVKPETADKLVELGWGIKNE